MLVELYFPNKENKSIWIEDKFFDFCGICQKKRHFEITQVLAHSISADLLIVEGICKICRRYKRIYFYERLINI